MVMALKFKWVCAWGLLVLVVPGAWCAPPDAVFAALRQAGISSQSVALVAQPVSDVAPALYEYNQDQPLTLASTTKIVTSLAALDLLGNKFRWRTQAYLSAPVVGGVMDGDMLLVGGGNAQLSAEDLVAWFKKIQAKGLKVIRGNIVVNHGAFQTKASDHAGTPVPTPEKPHHVWPDAFVVDEGVITIDIGTKAGAPVLSYRPRLDGVEITNELRVSARKCSALREPVKAYFEDIGGPPRLRVTGEWAPGCSPARLQLGTLPGSRFTLLAVAAAWRDAGGFLEGEAIQPESAYAKLSVKRGIKPYAVQESSALPEMLVDMNKWSNNLIARHLMLSLSTGFPQRPATLPEARKRVAQWLVTQGFSKDDLVVDNGSGLAHEERGRARALVSLLRKAWASPNGPSFLESLPVAGEDGTMSMRLTSTATQGKAYLKTGTLNDTRSLAGYVQGRSGRMYAVAAIINDPNASKGRSALDKFIEWVMEQG